MKHLKYLWYVTKHRWFVFLECCKRGIPLRGLLHDLSKYHPKEWFAYAEHFYGEKKEAERDSTGYYKPVNTWDAAFDLAWLHHANHNSHHWQYWVTPCIEWSEDKLFVESLSVYEMSRKDILEMIADWHGAARAQGSKSSAQEWYNANKAKMIFAPVTRVLIERYLFCPDEDSLDYMSI